MDVVYLYFKNLFDIIPQNRQILKLEAYGISWNLKEWTREGVNQWWVVNPQGRLFISDCPEMVESTAKIFTDDTKLFRCITTEEERHKIQTDLDMPVKCSEDWHLGGCNVLPLGSSNPKHDHHMKGASLVVATEERFLGVIIDEELKFHKYVAAAVKKYSRMLGLIRATCTCISEVTFPRLFNKLVESHLSMATSYNHYVSRGIV